MYIIIGGSVIKYGFEAISKTCTNEFLSATLFLWSLGQATIYQSFETNFKLK
jgi:hypothetical protein